jgi:hypothetical protein
VRSASRIYWSLKRLKDGNVSISHINNLFALKLLSCDISTWQMRALFCINYV